MHSVDDFEVLLAGDADLHRPERRDAVCTMNTPSDSFFFVRFDVSAGVAAWAAGGEVDADRCSVDTGVFSRTVSAMMGIASACLRVSVRTARWQTGRGAPRPEDWRA